MNLDPEPPPSLAVAGTSFWRDVVSRYELTPAEAVTLLEAARTADELDRLEHEVRGLSTLTTTGSTGQLKAHPLLAEVRAHRALLAALCASLGLPEDGEATGLRPAQRHAQRAANARWAPRRKDAADV